MAFSFLLLVPVSLNNLYIFQNVSVNAVMAQTFLPGVTNWNTGMSRREIEVFDPQACLGVTLGRSSNWFALKFH